MFEHRGAPIAHELRRASSLRGDATGRPALRPPCQARISTVGICFSQGREDMVTGSNSVSKYDSTRVSTCCSRNGATLVPPHSLMFCFLSHSSMFHDAMDLHGLVDTVLNFAVYRGSFD